MLAAFIWQDLQSAKRWTDRRHGGCFCRNVDLLCSFSSASRWWYKITFLLWTFKCCFMAELLIIGYNYICLPHSKCSFAAVSRLMYTRSYTSYTATDADMLKKNLNRGFPLYMKQTHHDLMVKPVFYKHPAHIFLFSPVTFVMFLLNRPSGTKRAF